MQTPDAVRSTDRAFPQQDLGPLAWVLDELRKSLDGAVKSVKLFAHNVAQAGPADAAALDPVALRIARQHLHSATGALEMVGMREAALVVRAMETAVHQFVQTPHACNENAAQVLERTSFAVNEFLEAVMAGKETSAVGLFPHYREVQTLAGSDRIHPADLWPLERRSVEPDLAILETPLYYGTQARSQLDQAVLKIVKGGDLQAARSLSNTSLGFAAALPAGPVRTFWKICAGFFDAMAAGLLPSDLYVKRVASRVLMQYATLARGDDTVSERLWQDMLFFCAQAPTSDNAPILAAVRQAYRLDRFSPVDYEVRRFGRYDPTVLAQARKRVAAATETWSALAGGDRHKLKPALDQFSLVGDSLRRLHPGSAPLADALAQATEAVARSGEPPSAALAMEVATAVLYLQATFDELSADDVQMAQRAEHLAQRLQRVQAGGQSEPLEAWMEDLYRRVSDRQTMGSVVGELRTSLGEVEKLMDQFFRNTTDTQPLMAVPDRLAQMRGVLSLLGLDQAALAVVRMRGTVEGFLSEAEMGNAVGSPTAFEKLGNSLGALGFMIDMLNYQRAMARTLFVYDETQGELRLLTGRVQSRADDTAEQAFVAVQERAPVAVAVVAEEAALPAPPVPESSPILAAVDLEEDDLVDVFLEEAREVVANGLVCVDALTAQPADLSEQTTLRRVFHTLKGSARMVGLSEFGEAAWSMEQLLNAWLADQKPMEQPLLLLCGDALRGFGLWAEDIEEGDAENWEAQAFRISADALRLDQQHVALTLPRGRAYTGAFELPDMPDVPSRATAIADLPDDDALLAHLPPSAFAQTDFAAHAPAPADAFEITRPASLVELAAMGFAMAPPAPEPAAAPLPELPAEPALVSADVATDFEDTNFLSDPLHQMEVVEAAEPVFLDEFVDLGFTAAPDAAPVSVEEIFAPVAPVEEPVVVDAGVYEQAVSEPAPEPEPAAEPEPEPALQDALVEAPEPGTEVVADPVTSAEDLVKVIGPLRIGIPLYNVYLNEADEWSRRLQMDLAEWSLELHQPVPETAVAMAHSMAGSSATVGFLALSELARLLEHTLQHVQLQSAYGTPEQARTFCDAAEDIRRLLHQFAAGFLKDPNPVTLQALRDILASDVGVSLAPAYDASEVAEVVDMAAVEVVFEENQPPAPEVSAQPAIENVASMLLPLHAQAMPVVANIDDDIDAVDVIDPDLFPIFEEEAIELLPRLGGALRQWAARPDNSSARHEALRTLHTLKGSSRLAGAMRLGELAHRLESAIERLDSENLQVAQVEPLLASFDGLQANFDALRVLSEQVQDTVVAAPQPGVAAKEGVPAPAVVVPLVPAASGHTPAPAAAAAAKLFLPTTPPMAPLRPAANQSVRVRAALLDRLVNQVGEVMITRSRLDVRLGQMRGALGDLSGNLDRLRQQLRDIEVQAESQMQSRLAQAKDSDAAFDPLEFDRFTRVQELTRMMAESVNDVATVQRGLQRTLEGTEDDLIAQGRQARELQRDLLRTRMVEFEGIAERLYAVVRQAAKETGKQITLDITGGSIEMDRGVLDRMTPAFEHLLRNAVVHGIEDVAHRTALGKPGAGSITIGLQQEGNDVSVTFRDDGRGLDIPAIRSKAQALGLITDDAYLTETDAATLIFQAGFTTATQVTELAGRGIGMDVVRAEVQALGGRIETATGVGQGTAFTMVLPLTTAVTHVVMMRSGALSIGVPASVVEIVRRTPADEVERAYQTGVFRLGEEDIPFFWSGALLQASARSVEPVTKNRPVVILRSAAQRVAIHVDEVLGNQEVVVKNLGPQLSRLPGLAGMSVLASGAVVLIYNPVALATVYGEQVRRAAEAQAAAPTQRGGGSVPAPVLAAVQQVPLVMVVDDSITVRRVTQRLLQREGYRVVLAADGLQALERLQEERPAVVLSDIEMPRMDGFDLARNIRADSALEGLPIIMITSRIAGKHREHAMELGVNNYLGKPYSEEELLSLVRSYTRAAAAQGVVA